MRAMTSAVSVRALTPTIGAELSGIDLGRPLDTEAVGVIRQALLDHLVIFFRDQDISPAEQFRFSEYFGTVMVPTIDTRSTEVSGVTVIDQIAPKGEYTDRWHTDHTFAPEPPLGTVLRAVQLPAAGGDTCFASMYAAYDALSADMQRFLEPLTAEHTTEIVTRGISHLTNIVRRDEGSFSSSVHPVIRIHPETGRRLLFVCGNFTTRIVELEERESRAVLAFLFEHIQSAHFQCRFRWEPNSVAFWDNRAAQHCAIPDYHERRLMYRTMISGDRPYGPPAAAGDIQQ
jgi:alpha-ketoglutarate-dependent taurine dioxygenase